MVRIGSPSSPATRTSSNSNRALTPPRYFRTQGWRPRKPQSPALGSASPLVKARTVGWRRHFLRSPALGSGWYSGCLLYTSDAADDLLCVDLGGRRIIKKK